MMRAPIKPPEIRLRMDTAQIMLPVSYTHLDVYKRQLYGSAADTAVVT